MNTTSINNAYLSLLEYHLVLFDSFVTFGARSEVKCF